MIELKAKDLPPAKIVHISVGNRPYTIKRKKDTLQCQKCLKWRRSLYVTPSGLGCQTCLNFSKYDKLRLKSEDLRKKLKETRDFASLQADFIVKPRKMHQNAFDLSILKLKSIEKQMNDILEAQIREHVQTADRET